MKLYGSRNNFKDIKNKCTYISGSAKKYEEK